MLRKLRRTPSLLRASTTILPLSPSRRVVTSKSVDMGGRETARTTCAQNLLYSGEATHAAPHLLLASLVQTAALPRPVCQWARTGSRFFPVVSGISICGLFFRLV